MRALGLALALLALSAPGKAAPQIQFDPAASNAFPTLSVPVGVRATGMGDVYTAVGDDVYALAWDPAGLSRVQGYQLGVMDNEWSSTLGLRQDFFGYAQALDDGRAWGMAVDYFDLGQLDQRDSSGALLGRVGASDLGLDLGYAAPLLGSPAWRGGVTLEAMQQSLYGDAQWAYGASVGALWLPGRAWSLGVSLDHLGVAAGGSSPAVLQAGVASQWMGGALLLAADAELPQAGTARLKAGGELAYGDLRFRAGWRQALGGGDDPQLSGMTAGVGFKLGSLSLDYSYVPYGDLSVVHRVQATVSLPRDFFVPRQAVLEGTTTSAKAFYDQAVALERQGETLKSLVQYQRSVEAYPVAQRAQALPFYAAAAKKVEDLQAQLSKGGDHSQIQKLTRGTIVEADRDMAAGRYKDAIARLEQARKLDPDSADLKARLLGAQQALESHLSAYRDAARFGAKEDNLSMGVENSIKILAIDPSDAESLAYLTAKRRAIKGLLQSIDRKAIYFYVAGHWEEAIKAWSDGVALDYFGDVDFKRNIDKARKQLELQDQK